MNATGIVAEIVPSPWRLHHAIVRSPEKGRSRNRGTAISYNTSFPTRVMVPSMVRNALERKGTFMKQYKFHNVGAKLLDRWKLSADAVDKMTVDEYRTFAIARTKTLMEEYKPNRIYGPAYQQTAPLARRRNVLVGFSRRTNIPLARAKYKMPKHQQYTGRNNLKKIITSTRVYNRVPSKRFHRKNPPRRFAPESTDSDSQHSLYAETVLSTLSSDYYGEDREPNDTNNDDPTSVGSNSKPHESNEANEALTISHSLNEHMDSQRPWQSPNI